MSDDETPEDQSLALPTEQKGQSHSQTAATAVMEVTTLVSNGGSACASSYRSGRDDNVTSNRLSIGSISFGLWELAVKSAIRIASARKNKNSAGEGGVKGEGGGGAEATPFPRQKALPPLPAVPPVGPGGCRKTRTSQLTRSQSVNSKYPPPSRPSPTERALNRSQSMADVLSAMVAARLKTANTPARSTHCQECNQRFSLIFRRHHCSTCRRSVCAYCSTYQRGTSDMDEETETETEVTTPTMRSAQQRERGRDNREREVEGGEDGKEEEEKPSNKKKEGRSKKKKTPQTQSKDQTAAQVILHRVCRKCASELEGKQVPYSHSWTEEFCSLRQFFKQGRQVDSVFDNHHLLPPKIPKLPPVCETIARSFLEECRKNVRNKSLFQTTSASFNAGLQYALKPPDQKLCCTCSKLLRFPVERKTCALCDKIYCRQCSSRDLALSVPDHFDPGDVGHEMAQVDVRILSKEEAAELDKHSNSAAPGTAAVAMQRYRSCHDCRDHVAHVLKVMNFNDTLTQVQAELIDLQEQIAAVLDEAVNRRVADKLLERYFQLYLELEKLRPETTTQGVLLKHVKQAMSAFYVTRRSMSYKRFRNTRTVSLDVPASSSPSSWN